MSQRKIPRKATDRGNELRGVIRATEEDALRTIRRDLGQCGFVCSVFMGAEGLNLYSNSKEVVRLLEGPFASFIPGWRISDEKANSGSRLYIFEQDSFFMQTNGRTVHLVGKLDDLSKGNTVPYVAQYLLEGERADAGKLTTHGAAVAKGDTGILILGKQGSGKTSLTLELCRKHGYSLIGNDLVILGGLENGEAHLYDGTKLFQVRLSTIRHYNQDLRPYFPDNPQTDEWHSVAYLSPQDLGITVQNNPSKIGRVILVHLVNDRESPLIVETQNLMFSRIYLHQIFSDYIRGSAIMPLVGASLEYSGFLPSLETPDSYRKREQLINWIIENNGYKYVSGPLPKIASYVGGIHDQA